MPIYICVCVCVYMYIRYVRQYTIHEFLIFLPTSADLISLLLVTSTIKVSVLNTATFFTYMICFFPLFLSNNINTRLNLINSSNRSQNK